MPSKHFSHTDPEPLLSSERTGAGVVALPLRPHELDVAAGRDAGRLGRRNIVLVGGNVASDGVGLLVERVRTGFGQAAVGEGAQGLVLP